MNIRKKSLAVGVILLFLGVAIAPSINFDIAKASIDNDLIEVTSETCGIKGFGNQTVKITKKQYQDLEQYLVDFRTRLNKTTTREEAVPIFNEAVVELNKYGLLPKGMSVEQAQKLVTSHNPLKNSFKILPNTCLKLDELDIKLSNILCFIAAYGKDTGLICGAYPIWLLFFILPPLNNFGLFLHIFASFLPISLMSILVMGTSNFNEIQPLYSFGLLGAKRDNITIENSQIIFGFTGIKLWIIHPSFRVLPTTFISIQTEPSSSTL